VLASVVGFVLLATVAWRSAAPDRVDAGVARAVHASPGSVLRAVADAVTVIGEPVVVATLAFVVAAYAWRRFRDPLRTALCPVAVGGTWAIGHLVKVAVARPRPLTAAAAHELDFSYPSGHATAATALAVAAGLLVYTTGMTRRRQAVVGVLAVYAVMVSASRLVLGVHYLTDVVGGALLGAAGAVSAGSACSRRPWSRSNRSPTAAPQVANR
jgi:undecaprenyl-diphosphatase